MPTQRGTGRRGFAAMDEQRRKDVARLGGQRAHQLGRAHEFTSEEAREAGRLGGLRRHETHTDTTNPEDEPRNEFSQDF